jgi:hypothetical protein
MNYSSINVKALTFFRWMNPSAIDLAPESPILLILLKEYYWNKICLIKMNPNINKIIW